MRGFLFELLPPFSELFKPPGRAFCRGPGLRSFLTHRLLDHDNINHINLRAHQSQGDYRVFDVVCCGNKRKQFLSLQAKGQGLATFIQEARSIFQSFTFPASYMTKHMTFP